MAVPSLHVSLYEEHLEEASMLYERRQAAFDDPELALADVAALDARLEAHQDALEVGGAGALACCAARVEDGDAGELRAGALAACRQGDAGVLSLAVERVRAELASDPQQGEGFARALESALQHPFAAQREALLRELLVDPDPHVARVGAAVAARHGVVTLGVEMLGAYQRHVTVRAELVRPLARLCPTQAPALLTELLARPDYEPGLQAALTLLPAGDAAIRDRVLRALGAFEWAALPVVLSAPATPGLAAALCRADLGGAHGGDLALALGLLGTPACVERLLAGLDELGEHERAAACAEGLALVSGQVVLEEATWRGDDQGLEGEDGEDETEADPEEWGTFTRLARKPDAWRGARELSGAGGPDSPWRMGAPAALRGTLCALAGAAPRQRTRGLLLDELALRYGLTPPFAIDDPASYQGACLASLAEG